METAAQTPNKPATTYDVARPGGKCAITGEVIEPGQKMMAALRETPQGLERLDVSMNAWPQVDRANILAFWLAHMPTAQQAKRKIFVDDVVLGELFERLANTEDSAKLNFRFVLGLILMRKRILVYESTRHEGETEIWKLRFRGREDLLEMINPRLTEPQMQDVSQQLSEILNQEL